MTTRRRKIRLTGCSSMSCADYNSAYCRECSHANYTGSATIDGRKYTWDFNSRFGPLFHCKAIGKKDWLPNSRHKVWDKFQIWHNRNFKAEGK
jgi:hypothetical protein